MTPKEKANELLDKCYPMFNHSVRDLFTKNCALMVVDEILKLRKGYFDCTNPMQDEKYWQEVKQEINNQ